MILYRKGSRELGESKMIIGYMRPYFDDTTCEIQKSILEDKSCHKYVIEKHSSAKKRISLKSMIEELNTGDIVIVTKLYTIADSTRHLVEILEAIERKGAYLRSIQEGIDTSNSARYSFSATVQHLVEFQSDVISERTRKGLTRAKKKGVAAGRPRKPDENVQKAILMYESKKYSLQEIKEETGISKSTLYRYLEN